MEEIQQGKAVYLVKDKAQSTDALHKSVESL
jgi:hypothetical protein